MQTSLCTFLWVRKAALVMAALPAPLSLLSPHPVTHITDIQCDGQTWEDVSKTETRGGIFMPCC